MRNLVVACIPCNQRKGASYWKPRPLKLHHSGRLPKPKPQPKPRKLPQQEYRELQALRAKRERLGIQ